MPVFGAAASPRSETVTGSAECYFVCTMSKIAAFNRFVQQGERHSDALLESFRFAAAHDDLIAVCTIREEAGEAI